MGPPCTGTAVRGRPPWASLFGYKLFSCILIGLIPDLSGIWKKSSILSGISEMLRFCRVFLEKQGDSVGSFDKIAILSGSTEEVLRSCRVCGVYVQFCRVRWGEVPDSVGSWAGVARLRRICRVRTVSFSILLGRAGGSARFCRVMGCGSNP